MLVSCDIHVLLFITVLLFDLATALLTVKDVCVCMSAQYLMCFRLNERTNVLCVYAYRYSFQCSLICVSGVGCTYMCVSVSVCGRTCMDVCFVHVDADAFARLSYVSVQDWILCLFLAFASLCFRMMLTWPHEPFQN